MLRYRLRPQIAVRSLTIAGIGLASVSLAACQHNPPPPATSQSSLVTSHMETSSQRIAAALEKLQRAQASSAPQNLPSPVDPATVPEQLRLNVTWESWDGEVEQAVRGVADRIGYKVVVHGVKPSAPPMVKVNVKDVPAVQVLESVGYQIGARGTVRLDINDAAVHLYYAPPKTGLQ